MNRRRTRLSTRAALGHVVVRGTIAAALIAGVGLVSLARCGRVSNAPLASSSAAPAVYRSVDGSTTATWFASIGVNTSAACAAGLSGADVSAMIAAGRQYLTDYAGDLGQADNALRSAAQNVADLEVVTTRGKASDADLLNLASARSALAAARSSRDALANGLRTASFGALSRTKSSALQQIASNSACPVPLQYRVINSSESGWCSLRDAAAARRAVQLRGGTLSSAAAQVLTTADADPGVVVATNAMSNNLASVRSAWTAAMQ